MINYTDGYRVNCSLVVSEYHLLYENATIIASTTNIILAIIEANGYAGLTIVKHSRMLSAIVIPMICAIADCATNVVLTALMLTTTVKYIFLSHIDRR